MNWFYLAAVGPIFWSISNHIDKFIISKYFKAGGLGSVVLFTCLFQTLVLPLILIFNQGVFGISPFHAIILVIFGAMGMFQLMIYFYALKEDSASVVVPLFQLIPVFTYILSYFILGETLTTRQIISGLAIIFGALILSLDISEKMPKIKGRILGLMVLSCLMISVNGVVFKVIALQENFWVSTFWGYLGGGVFGIFLAIIVKSFREQFIRVIKSNSKLVISLNVFNELISLIAFLCTSFATLLAPVALVYVIGGIQPFFVLLFGVLITVFWPKFGTENMGKRHMTQKVIAIIIIFAGTYFLNT